ncbi:glycosyltransferase family 87 protein [Paraburkholderia sp. 40]|uniref:glycosyltransferase family 87 protein n=1 Tax=Paraburkholderia sp. 40 TaxID=2991059 RepID=UPI003D205E96
MTTQETRRKVTSTFQFLLVFVPGFVLIVQFIPLALGLVARYVIGIGNAPAIGNDFGIFWAAARVELAHGAAAVYSPRWMQPLEAVVRSSSQYDPCPYPPTFLLAIRPLGYLSYPCALFLFLALGTGIYCTIALRIGRRLEQTQRQSILIAALAGMPLAIYAGQNTLFTAAAAAAALVLMEPAPICAGACLAVLLVKPQLGVLFPIALVCGRRWKMLLATIVFCSAFMLSSIAISGIEAWSSFFSYLPVFRQAALLDGRDHHWFGMPTLFATARLAGMPVAVAYAVQALAAIPAVLAVAYLWLVSARYELRAAALLVASLLVQPYLMTYDLAWLGFPAALLIHDAVAGELTRLDRLALGAVWSMPVYELIGATSRLPFHLAPVAMILMLTAIVRRHRTSYRPTQRLSGLADERSDRLVETRG